MVASAKSSPSTTETTRMKRSRSVPNSEIGRPAPAIALRTTSCTCSPTSGMPDQDSPPATPPLSPLPAGRDAGQGLPDVDPTLDHRLAAGVDGATRLREPGQELEELPD